MRASIGGETRVFEEFGNVILSARWNTSNYVISSIGWIGPVFS